MRLEKINGNSYYLPAPTNIGVYQFKDKYSLLVDSGDNKQQARKIDEALQEAGLNVKYIYNTHHHIDHCGGNPYFDEHYPGSVFYASSGESTYLQNERLFSAHIYGGNPPHDLTRHFHHSKELRLDETLLPGLTKINDERFELVSLPGHSPDLMGLGTRDRVFYAGDALFSAEIIAKYNFPFLFDIAAQFKSYETLAQLDYDYYVLGHAEKVYQPEDFQDLIKLNRQQLDEILELVLDLLLQPKTREELLEEISILKELEMDLKQYFFSLSTTAALISYLMDRDEVVYSLENGKMFYYRKP